MNIEKLSTRGNTSKLIESLRNALEQEGKAGKPRCNEYQVWNRPDLRLCSWKFNEWDYYGKKNLVLPSNARGLFTLHNEIVIRGYDKFFNVGELKSTWWESIESQTCGPYYLTVKENGCIVFISGLQDGTLIVTSKHSTGPREDIRESRNHSWVANEWVNKHLAKAHKTREELAKCLYDLNVTAVGELCDDEFEEHILAYPKDESGIYLHGLNLNCPEFVTHKFEDVDAVAAAFGFHKTEYEIKHDITELRQFLEQCAETGTWRGRQVEGFVVRSKKGNIDGCGAKIDFFFKYKFEEPYLMFRQWRELTKHALSRKPGDPIPPIKKHEKLSRAYLNYVVPILMADEGLRESYLNNRGIIEMRQRFLDAHNLDPSKILVLQHEEETKKPSKIALIPVATIGCGKTTVSVALAKLTGWGHVQSDDFKSNRKRFVGAAVAEFSTHDVVILDRNNQSRQNRADLFDDLGAYVDVRYVCLNFLPDGVTKQAKQVTEDRVISRGDNHQTIRNMHEKKVLGIMSRFYNQFEPVTPELEPDSNFELVIDLDVSAGSKANTRKILEAMQAHFQPVIDVSVVDEAQLDAAVKQALDYKPALIAELSQCVNPEYFAVQIISFNKPEVVSLVDSLIDDTVSCPLWRIAKTGDEGHIQESFHVTVAHVLDRKKGPEKAQFFKSYKGKLSSAKLDKSKIVAREPTPLPGQTTDVLLKSLVFDNDIMAFEVELQVACANEIPHVTIAMRNGMKPFQSNDMLASSDAVRIPCNIKLEAQPVCVWMS